MPPEIRVIGVQGMPEVQVGDNLASQIMDAAREQGAAIESGDVLVVTQKIVSKAEGRVIRWRVRESLLFPAFQDNGNDRHSHFSTLKVCAGQTRLMLSASSVCLPAGMIMVIMPSELGDLHIGPASGK